MMTASYTPMIEQYREIKARHPNEILFYRLGDFYEMFFTDAELVSRELEITLTSREGGQGNRIPMCGVPFHAADNYLAKLITKGYKVAICEQVEDPKQAKGIVRREVIKIVTPGTVLSDNLLTANNNYLVVLYEEEQELYFAASDISTGESMWASFSGVNRMGILCDQLFRLLPSEIVICGKIEHLDILHLFTEQRLPNCTYTDLTVDCYHAIKEIPAQYFGADSLPQKDGALLTVGCMLYYLQEMTKADLTHINQLVQYNADEHLIIDASTLRNLEITRNLRDGGKKGTLLAVLDFTKTAMGGRLLKRWLEYPLMNSQQIVKRQDAIAELLKKPVLIQTLQELLNDIYDFERILTRVEVGTANARDLVALKTSFAALPELKRQLLGLDAAFIQECHVNISTHTDIYNLIHTALVDTPPFSMREGGMIKPGYDLELDDLTAISRDTKQWVQNLEASQREETGIKSLKIGYNKVFGYYIEVTHSNTNAVPLHYVRKQTLSNAERYITPELKEFETKILGAQERIVNIEYQLFITVRDYVKMHIREIQNTARQIAAIDTIVSLSMAAMRYNYNRPTINHSREILVKDGRHPVVERLLGKNLFVPNDIILNHKDHEIIVITGPNMAGKSTYMRQVALLVLMTQIGSYIPAREASIGPVDRIFTRVGASDDLATGQSTFMVEMNEVSQIIKYATTNSLVILDEIGRGTSTFDGMSIAQAVIEYMKSKIRAKTLFATHYHELTELANRTPGIENYSVAVKERGNDVVFLRRIIRGGADKSYGIHVAQLAGIPNKITMRAQEILAAIEASHGVVAAQASSAEVQQTVPTSLFSSILTEELLQVDVMTITPIEALNILFRLQNQAKQEAGIL